MTIEIGYSKTALAFLDKNQTNITRDEGDALIIKAIKKIYKIEVVSIDLKALKGEVGVYRVRKGNIRIIFTVDKSGNAIIVSINNIDFRGSVYKK